MDHGHFSEFVLQKTCNNIFGPDLVFLSPEAESDAGKKEELTDVLILLDTYLITIQSKSVILKSSELDDIKHGRLVKKYEDAKRQINRTLNAYNRKTKTTLKTCFKKELILPWSNIKEIISIITINLEDEEYANAEYRYQFPLKYEKYKDVDLHTFVLRDFYNLIQEFNTGGSFIHYLEERKFLSTKILQNYTNELDIVALCVSSHQYIEEIHKNNYSGIVIETGLWEEYRKRQKDIQKRDQKKFSTSLIEFITMEMRLSFDYTIQLTGIDIEQMTSNYFHIIGVFSLLSRVEAIYLTDIFMEKMESTREKHFRYFAFPKNDKALIFLIANEPNRETRKNKLIGLIGFAAKHFKKQERFSNVSELIGIVTEGQQLPGRSLDIIAMKIEDALDVIEQDNPMELFKTVDKGHIDEWSM